MEGKYIINEGKFACKEVEQPIAEDYYDVNESEAERAERIFLCSEVKENES